MIDWIGSITLLVAVSMTALGKPKLMFLAFVLNFIGDVLFTIFFIFISYNLAFILLNGTFAIIAIYGMCKWYNHHPSTNA